MKSFLPVMINKQARSLFGGKELSVNFDHGYYTYKYPSEQVVTHLSVLSKSFRNNEKIKALDFGFGAGRHLKLLADFGFNVYGLDIKQDAKDTTKHNFGGIIPDENLVIDDICKKPNVFETEYFDLVIGIASIYVTPYKKMLEVLDALIPMIRPGGYFMANFRTKFDDAYLNATEMLDEFTPNMPKGWANYSFLDIHDLERLMRRYNMKIHFLERYERFLNNNSSRLSYWMVTAQKENIHI